MEAGTEGKSHWSVKVLKMRPKTTMPEGTVAPYTLNTHICIYMYMYIYTLEKSIV